MSTRLTKKGTPMVDSKALRLVLNTARINDLMTRHLTSALKDMGYKSITPSSLTFLSTLDCGINHGSEIARKLGVSRQMIAKTVKELCRVGYLEQVSTDGKQKQILFTKNGELLMSDARQILANIDRSLVKKIGKKNIETTISALSEIQALVSKLNKT